LLLIGLMGGILSGTFGVGGGIIVVPALVFFLGFTQHQAQGTSLTLLLAPVMLFAVINYHKSGNVNFKAAFILMIAFVVGGYLGSKFAINFPADKLKKIFGVLMIMAALKMIFGK